MKRRYVIACSCGHRMRVRERHLGRVCRCTHCREPILVTLDAVSPPINPFAPDAPRHFAADEVPVHWRRGDRFAGVYQVVDELGRGGMGVVHLVRHKGWGTDIAVKTPKHSLIASEKAKEVFEHECETWVNLDVHPYVTQCFYIRRLGGIPRIFMEYVPGGALRRWILNRKLYEGSPEEVSERIVRIAIQVAYGLEHAHRQGLVHQDVKPSNVLLTQEGNAKVCDFGLVRAGAAPAEQQEGAEAGEDVEPNPLLGTPPYSSPEQAYLGRVTHKCDMWSWAAMVMEMLTGKLTWANSQALLEQADRYLEAGGQVAGAIPEALADVLGHCLREDPEQRPASMVEVIQALETISPGSAAFHPRTLYQVAASCDTLNNRAVSLLDLNKSQTAEDLWAQALESDPDCVEAFYNRQLYRWRQGRTTCTNAVQHLHDLCERNPDSWRARYGLGCALLETGNAAGALEVLRGIADIAAARREVMYAIAAARTREKDSRRLLHTFRAHRQPVRSVYLASDASRAVSGSEDGQIRLWDLTFGQCTATLQAHEGAVRAVCLSAGLKRMASGGADGHVIVWDAKIGESLHVLKGHGAVVRAVRFTEDHRQVFSASQDSTVRVWDVASGKCVAVLEGHTAGVNAIDVSRCGRYVLSGSRDNTLKYWDCHKGECLITFTGHHSRIHAVCLSADKQLAVSASRDATLKVWDVLTGECLRTLRGHHTEAYAVCLTEDAHFALSASRQGTLRVWDVRSGQCLCSMKGEAPVSLSRDSRLALSGNDKGELSLWAIFADKEPVRAPFLIRRPDLVPEPVSVGV